MHGALSGNLVLDLSRLLPGPYCSMILADHGARVIAIESSRFQHEALPVLSHINRNKEHMSLNLKTDTGRSVFFRLLEKADIVLEGFRPGVTDRLGIGYETLRKANPGIIYCAVTGYGQTGHQKDQVGHDVNYMGYGGALSIIGEKAGGPCIPGIQIADITGSLNAVIGILLALQAREKTGRGQYVDISMTDCITALLPIVAGMYWTLGAPPARGDALLSHRYACYNIYETADRKHVTIGALEPRFWARVCEFFEVPEYIPLQFDEKRREEILSFFRRQFKKKERDEWAEDLSSVDLCFGEVLEPNEALNGEAARQREMVIEKSLPRGGSLPMLGIPVKLSDTPGEIHRMPPEFGQDTENILKEIGYSDADVRRFAHEGVI